MQCHHRLGAIHMLICPHCNIEICMRELPHPGLFDNYRICPACQGKFTPDIKTKRRQAFGIFIGTISLVITILLYFDGTRWLVPAIISYVVIGLLIYVGNKHIFLVSCENGKNTNSNT